MPIPPYMWLKDDGGADTKGSVDVQEREGSIETRLSPSHPPSPPEHLPPVPRHKSLLRIACFPLRQGNRLTIKIPEQPANDAPAVHRRRNLDAHILIQTNGSFIKSLMVNRAERQAVRDFAGAAVLLPLDMSRFQGDGGIIMAHIEAADRALIVIGTQHLLAKMWVAFFADLQQIKPHLFSQLFLNTLRKVRLEDLMGEGIDQLLISVE